MGLRDLGLKSEYLYLGFFFFFCFKNIIYTGRVRAGYA